MKIVKYLLAVLAVVLITAPASAESWPHEREGFMIGFNIGGGSATTKPDEGADDSGGGGAGAFRLGWAFNDQFVLGFETNAWVGETDLNADLTLSTYLINFTWYPGAKGWFLRAGFGGGTAEVPGDIFDAKVTFTEDGGGVNLGAGHEWRRPWTFALGAAID